MNTIDGNVKVAFADYGKYFVDPVHRDFTFKPSSVPFVVGATIDPSLLAPEPYAAGVVVTSTPTVPTVSLSVSPVSLTTGSSATLTWSSMDVTGCTASGDWSGAKAMNGSESTGGLTAGTTTYTLSCTGAGGSVTKSISITATDPVVTTPVASTTFKVGDWILTKNNVNVRTGAFRSADNLIGVNPAGSVGKLVEGPIVALDTTYGVITWFKVDFTTGFDGWVGADNFLLTTASVTVTPTTPTLSLSASPASVIVGNSSVLSWTSANATACTASGAWNGAKAVNGSESTSVLGTVSTSTYSLTCTGTVGTVTKSVVVRAVSSGTIATATTTTLVSTINNVNVRATPNGAKLGIQPAGAKGTLGAQPSVTTAGHVWVYVDFDSGVDGWVARRYLTVMQPLVSATTTTALTEVEVQAKITYLVAQLATLQQLLAKLQVM